MGSRIETWSRDNDNWRSRINDKTLGEHLTDIDPNSFIRIISPHHDYSGFLDDEEFYDLIVDFFDFKVYNIFVDEEGHQTFDLGRDIKFFPLED